MQSDKDLYRQFRELSCEQLWEREIPAFDRASPRERSKRVSLIRALGVVFSASGSVEQRGSLRAWLRGLLKDPDEKVRRYAVSALPKLGAGADEEAELLALLESSQVQRERKFLERALSKIGGEAALEHVTRSPGLLPRTEQKLRANVAREQRPSSIRLDAVFAEFADLRIQLRCRRGLEGILGDEANDSVARRARFRVVSVHEAVVVLAPVAPFSLADLYSLRCFASAGFVLGTIPDSGRSETVEALAAAITQPRARDLFRSFTEGSVRYRLEFIGRREPHEVRAEVINRAYALCPEILNDARAAPWAIDVRRVPGGSSVVLLPKFAPDPRLGYRRDDVAAASHPPLAAAMARIAGRQPGEIVWDPFCGSGLELVESALLGGVKKLIGTDLSADAIAIARANVAAAKLGGIETHFASCDFRNHACVPDLGPRSVSLIITNPPMGRRIRVADLSGLVADLLAVAANVLRPGGRLVFVNPSKIEPSDATLRLRHRLTIDMGGFDGRLEVYEKLAR